MSKLISGSTNGQGQYGQLKSVVTQLRGSMPVLLRLFGSVRIILVGDMNGFVPRPQMSVKTFKFVSVQPLNISTDSESTSGHSGNSCSYGC